MLESSFQAQISGAMSLYTKNCFSNSVKSVMIQSMCYFSIFIKGGVFLKVIYDICCRVDVHKTFLVATIIKTNNSDKPVYSKMRFSAFNKQLYLFAKWLKDNNCLDVCMESTGKY